MPLPLKQREMTKGQYETILTLCYQAGVSETELDSIIKIHDNTRSIIDFKEKNIKLVLAAKLCNYLKVKYNNILRKENKKTLRLMPSNLDYVQG